MNIQGIIIAVAVVAAVGLFIGIFLGIASIIFKVFVDEREEKIVEVLPGNNCGGCGYPGCSGLAAAICKGEAPVNGCPVGGAAVGKKVAAIMGVEAPDGKQMVAFVKCQGDCEKTNSNYEYTGEEDCQMMAFVPGQGPKSCNFGCQGWGSTASASRYACRTSGSLRIRASSRTFSASRAAPPGPTTLFPRRSFSARWTLSDISM